MEGSADHMGLATDKAFTKLLEAGGNYYAETICFSSKLIKFNEHSKAQERTFAITSKAVYNLKSKSEN